MIYKVFADTNVYLDFLMHRGSEWQEAENIFDLGEKRIIEVITSASCLLNLMYIMGNHKLSRSLIVSHTEKILTYSKLINPDNSTFQKALASGFRDNEDAVQYYTAVAAGIDYFITSNNKDFKKSSAQLPVLTPKQFMKLYLKGLNR